MVEFVFLDYGQLSLMWINVGLRRLVGEALLNDEHGVLELG